MSMLLAGVPIMSQDEFVHENSPFPAPIMNPFVRICFVIHNHQPVGNFDFVIEQAYQDSYLPFLDVFEEYEHLKLSLHTSGPLMNWLDANHSEYLDRVADLVAAGRVEIIGGPYYDSIERPNRSNHQLLKMAGGSIQHTGQRNVDAGASLGAKLDVGYCRGRYQVYRSRRLSLCQCGHG
jgi:hypothetical protein